MLVLISLLLAIAVMHQGIANRLARSRPALASQFAPHNARIAMDAARKAVEAGASATAPEVRKLVDAALLRDATLTSAIEMRALRAEADGDMRKEAALFALSSAISRRSLPTRLWLMQHHVDRGDVAGALDESDIALRTSSAAPEVLFPVLARAASDPALAGPIAHVLDRPTEWRAMFLHYAITEAGAASAMADVVLHMHDRAMIAAGRIDQMLIGRLVAEGKFASARAVHDAFHPAAKTASLVRDPDFSDPAQLFPFGWNLVETGRAGVTRSQSEGRSVLSYQAVTLGGGEVASQLLMLPEGGYRFLAKAADAANDHESAPYWTITCAEEGGAQIALFDQPTRRGALAAADFSVPPGCAAQWLALSLRPSELTEGQSGTIASVSIVRRPA
ncbi:MAG: hypothetical protein ACM3YM_00250 [Sphingomonadales bacterium]